MEESPTTRKDSLVKIVGQTGNTNEVDSSMRPAEIIRLQQMGLSLKQIMQLHEARNDIDKNSSAAVKKRYTDMMLRLNIIGR